jgi:hypothetical protein
MKRKLTCHSLFSRPLKRQIPSAFLGWALLAFADSAGAQTEYTWDGDTDASFGTPGNLPLFLTSGDEKTTWLFLLSDLLTQSAGVTIDPFSQDSAVFKPS